MLHKSEIHAIHAHAHVDNVKANKGDVLLAQGGKLLAHGGAPDAGATAQVQHALWQRHGLLLKLDAAATAIDLPRQLVPEGLARELSDVAGERVAAVGGVWVFSTGAHYGGRRGRFRGGGLWRARD